MDGWMIAVLRAAWEARFSRARIDKIHQPTERELVLTLRTNQTTRVLLSAHRAYARAHEIRKTRPTNPEEAPMFCMLLRKRLEGGRIIDVRQQGQDRVLELVIDSLNEIGDSVVYVLVLEMMGKHSNIILCSTDETGQPLRVIDSIVHVTPDMSRVRPIMPGTFYTPAPPQTKIAVSDLTAQHLYDLQLATLSAKAQNRALSRLIRGIGPVTASEAVVRSTQSSANSSDFEVTLVQEFQLLDAILRTSQEPATIGLDELARPIAAAPFKLTSFDQRREMIDFDEALETFYAELAVRQQVTQRARDLTLQVASLLDRLQGKLSKVSSLERDTVMHDDLRIRAELLTTYAYQVHKGAKEVTLPNFYANDEPLTIQLDPALTAIQNAQKYYKQSSKLKRGIPILLDERVKTQADIDYLDGIRVQLTQGSDEVLRSLREELEQQGFLKVANKKRMQNKSTDTKASTHPLGFQSQDGLLIQVGRNNLQNDRLTCKTSQPSDIWLHVKDNPGSHVVVRASHDVPQATLDEAAILAAYFSKARDSGNVSVDYTQIRHVWKPNGARPGHVLYDNQKTLFVTPSRTIVNEILSRTTSQ